MRVQNWVPFVSVLFMFTISAFGQGTNTSFQASIIGCIRNLTIGGISSAGASWAVSQSNVSIQPNSQGLWDIQVQIQNLLLTSGAGMGTTGSVRAVAASVVCGGRGGAVAVTTPSAVLDRSGATQIQTTANLPPSCRAPVVLVRVSNPGTAIGSFIASTGLTLAHLLAWRTTTTIRKTTQTNKRGIADRSCPGLRAPWDAGAIEWRKCSFLRFVLSVLPRAGTLLP